jgi:hypothetical protein
LKTPARETILLFTKKLTTMRKTFFLWLFIAAAFIASGQGKTLYEVNIVKPKVGMRSTFETKWKAHLAQFHKTDDKRKVYEVVSGPHSGEYHIVEGPISYADMDTERPNGKEHGLDLEKNFSPYLEPNSMNATFRWDDTASFNGKVEATKFQVTVTHVKWNMITETIRESRRGSLINAKLNQANNTPLRFSTNVYTKIMSGSDPVRVTIRNLKDGFKELETDYYGPNPMANQPNAFRDAYIKDYGYDAWDARQKVLDNNANVASREVYLMILRKDLSSE